MQARKWHRSDVMTLEMLDARALIVGSPTLNNNIFPALMDVMTYIKGTEAFKQNCGIIRLLWLSGEAANLLATELENMKFML